MHYGLLFIILACVVGFTMAWTVGANDLASVISTTMGSRAMSVRKAMTIAIVFEFAGALLGGGNVMHTLRSGIINTALLPDAPHQIIYGMLSVLLAGTTWMSFASYFGLPVSITNAIVGGLVGFGTVVLGVHAIAWHEVGIIAISWVTSPILGGIAAYLLFMSVQRLILSADDPPRQARRYVPCYLFLVGFILSEFTVIRAIRRSGIDLTFLESLGAAIASGLCITIMGFPFIRRVRMQHEKHLKGQYAYVEKLFSVLMALTACAMVFAHGSNDVAITVGPVEAVYSIVRTGGLSDSTPGLFAISILGCSGVVLGLVMYGRKVIATVGSHITALTPSRGFCATLAAATTVVISTGTGIPVSATQTLVGSVLGVGLARGIGALNISVIRNIFMSWIITIPATSVLAMGYYYLLKGIFGL